MGRDHVTRPKLFVDSRASPDASQQEYATGSEGVSFCTLSCFGFQSVLMKERGGDRFEERSGNNHRVRSAMGERVRGGESVRARAAIANAYSTTPKNPKGE